MSPTPESPVRRRTAGDRGMLRATLAALIVGLLIDVMVIVIAAVAFDSPALVGALIGTGLTLVVVVPTAVSAYLAPRLSPLAMAVTVLASWAGKMVVVIVVLILLRDVEAVSFLWVGLTLLVGALSGVAVEMILLAKVRQPLDVAPAESDTDAQETP